MNESLCYCSICRKTQGGGGYAINLGGDAKTLSVKGGENISVYNAKIQDPDSSTTKISSANRRFCKKCGSCLWLDDPTWPELLHPFASAIDTELPVPPERTHLMVDFKAPWVQPTFGVKDKKFDCYPEESIADWHQRLELEK
ncbi:hypothetical protein O6H91_Y025700 [Diphasiastrum complanatum]|nr:hypothetical protein O6H91_Y025700 [Diphasiastrum complanatum]